MTEKEVLGELMSLLGGDIVKAPDAALLEKHTHDYCVHGRTDVGVLALVFPRNTEQVSKTLRFCNERGIAVQPQGGLTGLAGGAVPVGPCVVLNLERMRTIKEIDAAAGTITVEAGVVMEAVQKAADAAELFFPLIWVVVAPARSAGMSPPTPAAIGCCAMAWRAIWCWVWKPCWPMALSSTHCAR
jgi:FAD/FMN-containing dehydrogenase